MLIPSHLESDLKLAVQKIRRSYLRDLATKYFSNIIPRRMITRLISIESQPMKFVEVVVVVIVIDLVCVFVVGLNSNNNIISNRNNNNKRNKKQYQPEQRQQPRAKQQQQPQL